MRVAAPEEGGGKDGLAPSSSSARPAASCGGHGERPSCWGGAPRCAGASSCPGSHQAGVGRGAQPGRAGWCRPAAALHHAAAEDNSLRRHEQGQVSAERT